MNIPDYYNQPKNEYNYDALSKNHLPPKQKDFSPSQNYNERNERNKYGGGKDLGMKKYDSGMRKSNQGQSYDYGYDKSPIYSYEKSYQKPYEKPYEKPQNVRYSRNSR